MVIDLHMHSTASDGTDAPEALAALAAAARLSAIALTDHDTTAGLADCRRACDHARVEFVPGIEISAEPDRPHATLHILGYGIRHDDARLAEALSQLQAGRRRRVPLILDALRQLGVDIEPAEVERIAGDGAVGRPHIAQVLIDKGYAKTMQDAFTRYLGEGAAAYVPKLRMPPSRAIVAIHDAGGVAVLAHASQLRCEGDEALQREVARLVELGLDGLEVWHPDHDAAMSARVERLAERFDLLATGGSDYHGSRKPVNLGDVPVPASRLEALLQAIARRH